MSDLILHHYLGSPFSEKVRLVLGYKRLAWQSVMVPVVMPKPDVVALTGGYRRTPFMQIGADVYCDSALMCRVIDRLAPQPALYPGVGDGPAARARAMGGRVSVLVRRSVHDATGRHPARLRRRAARSREGLRRRSAGDDRRHAPRDDCRCRRATRERIASGSSRCSATTARSCSAATHASPIFRSRSRSGSCFLRRRWRLALEPYPKLLAWYRRVAEFGHGKSTRLSSADAIDIAKRVERPCAGSRSSRVWASMPAPRSP